MALGAPKTAPRSGALLGGAAAEPKVTFGASVETTVAFFGDEDELDSALLLLLFLYFSKSAK